MPPTQPISAEADATPLPDVLMEMTPEAMRQTLHDLQIHHLELEMQNEELRRTQTKLAAAEARYFDLYDLAPVGYVTLSEDGLILEANLTAATLLGGVRSALVGQPLFRFICREYQDTYYLHRQRLVEGGRWQDCDLRMVTADGSPFWAHLASAATCDPQGVTECRVVISDITERKQVEQALQQSEALLSATQSLSKVGGWVWDLEQQVVFWTEETYRIHDFPVGTMGPALPEYLDKSLGCCDEAYRPMILASFQRCAEHGDPYDIEYPFTTATGRRLWVRTTAHALRDEDGRIIKAIGTMMDITDRKRLEQTLLEWNHKLECRVAERTIELQQSESRLTQLAEATFEGLAVSEGGRLVDGNTQLGEILGYSLDEMIGRPVVDFVAPESRAAVAEHLRNGHELPYEFNGLRKDGSSFPAEAHASMRIWQGKRTRVTAVRDLTTVKRDAARSLAQQAELEQSRRLALISEISAGIIHQIGQPLSAIGANLAAAMARAKAAGTPASELLDTLRDIEANVVRMRESTVHLRALAHPEHPTRVRVDLNDLVAGVLKLEWHDVVSRQVQFASDFDPDLPPVLADPVQLSHVVCILRRNAIEACADCPPERQSVTISTRRLADEGLELCVRDAGSGIPPAVMSQLFTPFFTTKTAGLGIGLRLCRTIIEAHGGHISASNNTDAPGATFRVVLPELAQ